MSSSSPFSFDPRRLFSSVSSPSPATTEESVTPPPIEGVLQDASGSTHTLKATSSEESVASSSSETDFVSYHGSPKEGMSPVSPTSLTRSNPSEIAEIMSLSQFNLETQATLVTGEPIVTQKATDPKILGLGQAYIDSRGIFAPSLGPTTRVYVVANATPNQVTNAFMDIANADKLLPEVDSVQAIFDAEETFPQVTYRLDRPTGNPLLPHIKDEITIKSSKENLSDGTAIVSFDQPHKSETYFRKIKGRLIATPYRSNKSLICLEIFVDLRGTALPRFVTDEALQEVGKELLSRILSLRPGNDTDQAPV